MNILRNLNNCIEIWRGNGFDFHWIHLKETDEETRSCFIRILSILPSKLVTLLVFSFVCCINSLFLSFRKFLQPSPTDGIDKIFIDKISIWKTLRFFKALVFLRNNKSVKTVQNEQSMEISCKQSIMIILHKQFWRIDYLPTFLLLCF